MGFCAPDLGGRSTSSQAESLNSGEAQRGLPVVGSVGESPVENFQGPVRATADLPRVTASDWGVCAWAVVSAAREARRKRNDSNAGDVFFIRLLTRFLARVRRL